MADPHIPPQHPLSFKITRLYTGPNQDTYFEDLETPLHPVTMGTLSDAHAIKSMKIRTMPGDYDMDFHCTDTRQYVVILSGAVEMQVSSGEKRIFTGGDIVLVEDTTGKGHQSRSVNGQERVSLFLALD